jgi:hypothetical protein
MGKTLPGEMTSAELADLLEKQLGDCAKHQKSTSEPARTKLLGRFSCQTKMNPDD